MKNENKIGVFCHSLTVDKNFKGLKKAVAYIPGCLGVEYLNKICSFLYDIVRGKYVIEHLFIWKDFYLMSDIYTQKDIYKKEVEAYDLMAEHWRSGEHNQFEAIITFQNIDGNSFKIYRTSPNVSKRHWIESALYNEPGNRKIIYKPNSDELNPGIITECIYRGVKFEDVD